MEKQKTEAAKHQILLRNVPMAVVEAISRKKIDILTNNPHRTTVSDSEAVFKIIMRG